MLEQVIKIFSIHVPLDDFTTIYVMLGEIDEEINCVTISFSAKGPDLVAQSTGKTPGEIP